MPVASVTESPNPVSIASLIGSKATVGTGPPLSRKISRLGLPSTISPIGISSGLL